MVRILRKSREIHWRKKKTNNISAHQFIKKFVANLHFGEKERKEEDDKKGKENESKNPI